MLTPSGCLNRQRRLRKVLDRERLDAAVLTDYREIYAFTGCLLPERFPACWFIETEGRSWLLAHAVEGQPCADEAMTYEWHQLYTTHPDLLHQLQAAIARKLCGCKPVRRIAWHSESLPHTLKAAVDRVLHPREWVAIDAALIDLHKRKDPDEVEILREAIRADLAAYTAVQKLIEPGINELEVLAAGQRAAMLAAGERVFHDGDYRSGLPGGFARDRGVERGEMYIIDAWTIYRGYWSDLCRAFVVGDTPTDLQSSLFEHLSGIQRKVPAMLKPGAKGTDLWRALDALIREHPALANSGLSHHAGHGVGLRPHEAPDINRDREGILEPGDVVSVEPGGYTSAARCGVRIENTYLITDSACVNLSDYPIEILPRRI
ncbi:MAG: aminopeptidase P family protein [Planctomycetes bacterium]|nr:aminopeptidase P family protein [Planctomycetota bacterium]